MDQIICYQLNQQPQVIENAWQVFRVSDVLSSNDIELLPLPNSGQWIIPFTYWKLHSQDANLLAKAMAGDVAIYFTAEDDVLLDFNLIDAGKKAWAFIAVDFPIFRDGRGFSTAALLRDRLAWNGPLWAIGDVLVDQLIQLARVGFDHFLLRSDQEVQIGLKQFSCFSVALQNCWRGHRAQSSVGLGKDRANLVTS